jgi:hypothetical protein
MTIDHCHMIFVHMPFVLLTCTLPFMILTTHVFVVCAFFFGENAVVVGW